MRTEDEFREYVVGNPASLGKIDVPGGVTRQIDGRSGAEWR